MFIVRTKFNFALSASLEQEEAAPKCQHVYAYTCISSPARHAVGPFRGKASCAGESICVGKYAVYLIRTMAISGTETKKNMEVPRTFIRIAPENKLTISVNHEGLV